VARKPYYQGPVSDHFDGTCFFLPGHDGDTRRRDLLRWQIGRERAPWPLDFPSPYAGARPDLRVQDLRITLIGHASFLIQAAGLNILIDPVWSPRAGPFRILGPRRVNPPGVAFEHLPPIDAVLLTHNHYDHMDLATLAKLRVVHGPRVLAPLGNAAILAARRIIPEELDWHQGTALAEGLEATLVPAQHWSARGLRDRRMALWGSYVLRGPMGTVYHVGDTGYGDGATFRAVRDRYGPPDVAVLPIGAYEPRWFMQTVHMNPAESVQAAWDCGAAMALGHHWGTFQLTDEPIDQPMRDLAVARAAFGIPEERFPALRPGQSWDLPARATLAVLSEEATSP
jgi:L-ascorbate metabolism protein UlaG (beta-lactamase superfamily)